MLLSQRLNLRIQISRLSPVSELNSDTMECRTCGLVKPRSDFQIIKRTRKLNNETVKRWDSINSKCRDCVSDRQRERRALAKVEDDGADIALPMMAETTKQELFVIRNASCKGDSRFTDSTRSIYRTSVREELKAICDNCPVNKQCKEEGDRIEMFDNHGEDTRWFAGFRAGETPVERAERRKAERVGKEGRKAS
jgi:hypothetical protein